MNWLGARFSDSTKFNQTNWHCVKVRIAQAGPPHYKAKQSYTRMIEFMFKRMVSKLYILSRYLFKRYVDNPLCCKRSSLFEHSWQKARPATAGSQRICILNYDINLSRIWSGVLTAHFAFCKLWSACDNLHNYSLLYAVIFLVSKTAFIIFHRQLNRCSVCRRNWSSKCTKHSCRYASLHM